MKSFPNSHFKANVTFNPYNGTNSNSVKPPEGELKIMFWNIQNLYEHGIMSADEYEIESGIGYNKLKKKSTDTSKATMKITKKNVDSHMKLTVQGTPTANKNDTFGTKAMRRHWVARTINDSGADIVVIAELAIGIVHLRENINDKIVALRNENALKDKKGMFMEVEVGGGSWGPQEIQIELNKLYDVEGNPWESAVSAVNAVKDFTCQMQNNRLVLTKGKNSMVEMYGLLWRSDRVSLGNKSISEAINLVTQDKTGTTLSFNERVPGHIEFFSPFDKSKKYFDLFCIHNLFGDEKGVGATDRIRSNRAEGINNIAKLGLFDPKKSQVVAGDFNLDMNNALEVPLYKPFSDHMKQRIKNTKTSYTDKGSVSAYDHIFTSELGDFDKDDGAIDIAVKYFGGSYEAAFKISDHMPVVAVLKSPLFDVAKPKFPFDTVTLPDDRKMKRVKSENPQNPGKDETNSLFLAAARSYIFKTGNTQYSESQWAEWLRQQVAERLYKADPKHFITGMVYQRIDDLYEVAKATNPLDAPKSLDQWQFDTNNPAEIKVASQVINLMVKGSNLDKALDQIAWNFSQEDYDYYYWLVWDAFRYEDNWQYRVNPKAVIPNVGKKLHQAFLKEPPQYEACYAAYCDDLVFPDGMIGSEPELYAVAEVFRTVINVYGVDNKGNARQWQYAAENDLFTLEMKGPIYLLRVDDRYDFLFE